MSLETQPDGSALVGSALAVAGGLVTAFALFWAMQALVGVEGELKGEGKSLSVDFVRLRKDRAPEMKKREPPKREKPEQAPPPPQMNMAKNMNPGDAVGTIIPMVDTGMELEQATSLGAAGGSDSDVTPLVRVDPEYPPRAMQQGIEGWVDVEFTITPAGTVRDARVLEAQPPFVFDRSVLRAVKKYRYAPKIVDGVPVERAGIQVRIRFDLDRSGR